MKISSNSFRLAILGSMLFLVGCTKNDEFSSQPATSESSKRVQSSGSAAENLHTQKIGDRSVEDILCQEGQRIVNRYPERDLQPSFDALCLQGKTTNLLEELINNAYDGLNEPQLKILASDSDAKTYVTNIRIAYAIRTPLSDPSLFAGLKAHDVFSAGIHAENASLTIKVTDRQAFPGQGSVERVRLHYNLTNANGAGIFDQRSTEFNTYLLVEENRDIVLATEHLTDGDSNRYYHRASGLMVGLKTDVAESYFVFVSDLVIKNRIDPDRIAVTLEKLNLTVPKMLLEHINQNL